MHSRMRKRAMVYQEYLSKLDDVIVTVIIKYAPIKFDALLREMETRVGCNNVNEETLQRRLKGLRRAKRITHNQTSPRGWVIIDDERQRNHSSPAVPRTGG